MSFSITFRGTETIIIDQMYGGRTPRPWQLLLASLAFCCLGIAVARHFFSANVGIISIFLCVLGLLPSLTNLFDQRKERRRKASRGSESAHEGRIDSRLAFSILLLFLGVMLAYGGWVLMLPVEESKQVFAAQLEPWLDMADPGFAVSSFGGILVNNLLVAVGVIVLSLLYRAGGTLLVLGWNASVWGTAFAFFARLEWGGGLRALGGWLRLSASVFPHILLEAVGYILMALAGLLLLRLIVRFGDPFLDRRSLAASVTMLVVFGVVSLVLAAAVETGLAPQLVKALSSS